MSTLKVTIERLTIHDHPNADALELAQVGEYRAVVGKGVYRTGDFAVYIPEQAIIPDPLIEELGLVGRLAGKAKNRVKAVRLRGEVSQGIVCRPKAIAEYSNMIGEDFAEELGITKWVPDIPAHMNGRVESCPDLIRWIDIENLQRYPDVFEFGEPVIATEKIHGCLHGRTRVLMADGSYRKIADLVKEEYRGNVLGMNDHGQVVETPVIATFDHGRTTDWLRVEVSRLGIGRGSSSGAVTMTPNHRVYSPNHDQADGEGFVLAGLLAVDDEVWLHRTEVTLPPLAEQVLIGKMLGDGSLADGGVQWGHIATQRDYVAWTAQMLGPDLCSGVIDERFTSGHGSEMARCATRSSMHIRELFEDWITSNGKQVPASVVDRIGPIALAFWYMDDGSLSHHASQEDRALFATNSFDEPSIDNLVKALDRFGVEAVKYQSSGWRLRLNAEAAERLFLLIAPYVPESMQYKLPERYRGGVAGFPRTFGAFKPTVRPQRVTSVAPVPNGGAGTRRDVASPRGSTKYDMQTGAGNYFANGMLVHNSACLLTYVHETGDVFVSSKGYGEKSLALVESDTNLYWRAARHYGLREKAARLAERYDLTRVGIFGEVFGQGVQDLTYGASAARDDTLGYRVFDIRVETEFGLSWVNAHEFHKVCADFDLPPVPLLYTGPFDLDALKWVATGSTKIGGGNIREGVVIRPATEGHSQVTGGRTIAKLISPTYLLRKGDTTEYE